MTNTLFPGRPDYTGPITGMFGLLHHDVLYETSHNVRERVAYVKRTKPENEVNIRLHNMIYLGGCDAVAKRAQLDADYLAKITPLAAYHRTKCALLIGDYRTKSAQLDADYEAKSALLLADHRAQCDLLLADYRAKLALRIAEILAYIKTHIPDCAWNGTELVF